MDKLKIIIKNKDLLNKEQFIKYLLLLKDKEIETYKHSVRVSKYSTELAKKMGFSEDIVSAVWLAGLLHDIGKLLVPNDILLSTTKLSDDDFKIIKKHPLHGLKYLDDITSERVYMGAIEHHERLNGEGYPYGVKYISTIGKIIAIADTFDAMTSNRTYQKAYAPLEALVKMEEMVDLNMYDKKIFNYFKGVVVELFEC